MAYRFKEILSQNEAPSRKRKNSDVVWETERRPSPFDRQLQQDSRTPSISRSPSASSAPTPVSTSPNTYNGVLDVDEHGFVFCRHVSAALVQKSINPDHNRRQAPTFPRSMSLTSPAWV